MTSKSCLSEIREEIANQGNVDTQFTELLGINAERGCKERDEDVTEVTSAKNFTKLWNETNSQNYFMTLKAQRIKILKAVLDLKRHITILPGGHREDFHSVAFHSHDKKASSVQTTLGKLFTKK